MMADAFLAVIGAATASVLACVPGLHVYSVMSLMVVGLHTLAAQGFSIPPSWLPPVFAGLLAGFSVLNTVPSILLAAPDESIFLTVLPGQKYLMRGRGYEGIMITAVGSLCGLFSLVFLMGPIAPCVLPILHRVFQPHVHWILWCVIAFMLMSEWPKGGTSGPAGWRRFADGWRSTGAGLLTFGLSGLLGFALFFRSPISPTMAFQNLMPAFVGLFSLPGLILNLIARVELPPQQVGGALHLKRGQVLRGAIAGGLGGGFAAFFPIVTGGVGSLLAGHATATRGDRVFLISQGASKLIYYVGGFLLLFVPGLAIVRGGAAAMLQSVYRPHSVEDYHRVLAAIAIGGAVSFLLTSPLTRLMLALMGRLGYRRISGAALCLIVALVFGLTDWTGLAVMVIGAAIGLIPLLFGSRRMNCLGVILLPAACNLSGIGAKIAHGLGLL